jgi:3-hydroxyisobutyrate dehydrogenase-like beta-hydroxyacid dehydrogenase
MGSIERADIGFVGLGAMGWHMAAHLATKLPSDVHLFVFDIVQSLVDQLCQEYPDRVTACENAKEVAERTVSCSIDHAVANH